MRGKWMLLATLLMAGAMVFAGCKDKDEAARTDTGAPGDRQMGAEGQEMQNLVNQLRTGTVDARQQAAERLGDLKVRSREAVDALGSALRDSSDDVRDAAADSLVKIKTSDSLRTLRQAGQDMKAKGQKGADSLQEKYNDAIDDVRDDAKDGEQYARDLLNDLSEPIEKPADKKIPDIDVDVNT